MRTIKTASRTVLRPTISRRRAVALQFLGNCRLRSQFCALFLLLLYGGGTWAQPDDNDLGGRLLPQPHGDDAPLPPYAQAIIARVDAETDEARALLHAAGRTDPALTDAVAEFLSSREWRKHYVRNMWDGNPALAGDLKSPAQIRNGLNLFFAVATGQQYERADDSRKLGQTLGFANDPRLDASFLLAGLTGDEYFLLQPLSPPQSVWSGLPGADKIRLYLSERETRRQALAAKADRLQAAVLDKSTPASGVAALLADFRASAAAESEIRRTALAQLYDALNVKEDPALEARLVAAGIGPGEVEVLLRDTNDNQKPPDPR